MGKITMVRVNYGISNLVPIHNELMKHAVLDSKEKAGVIAETLGEKILGIKEICGTDMRRNRVMNCYAIPAFLTSNTSDTPLADMLSLPKQEEREEIEVIWHTKQR